MNYSTLTDQLSVSATCIDVSSKSWYQSW